MSENYQSHRPRSRARLAWIMAALCLAVLAAGFLIRRAIFKSRLEARLQEIRQQGVPVTLNELNEVEGFLPVQENAAFAIMEAGKALSPHSGKATDLTWQKKNAQLNASPGLPPQELEKLKAALKENAEALAAAHQAAARPRSRFVQDWRAGPGTLMPHLARISALVQMMRVEAIVASEEGNAPGAVRSVADMIRLTRALQTEPCLISQQVRGNGLSMAARTLEWVLSQHSLSEAQLKELQTLFIEAEADNMQGMAQGFMGELCLGIYIFQSSPRQMENFYADGSNPNSSVPFRFIGGILDATGEHHRDFLFYLDTMTQAQAAARLPYPQALERTEEISRRFEEESARHRFWLRSRLLVPAAHSVLEKSARIQRTLRMAITALEVEQHRRRAGQLPESLDALQKPLLTDPFSGSPFSYERLAQGYSISDGAEEEAPKPGQTGARENRSFVVKR